MTAPERHQAAILQAVEEGSTTVDELVRATKLRAHQVRSHANALVRAGKLYKKLELIGDRLTRSKKCRYSLVQ